MASGLVLAILYYGAVGYLAFNTQRAADQLRVWNFTETSAIAQQVSRDNMSGEGRFLYLASEPRIESKSTFNATCQPITNDTSILGCYNAKTKRIYLYHQTDKRFNGSEAVMAAYEMLRAAWDRMSVAERSPLIPQLNHILATNTDKNLSLASRMKAIERNDPAHRNAELYAIVGTEVPNVGGTLEQSYDQYFVQRSTVTALNTHAQAFLIAFQKKVKDLVTTMDALGKEITSRVDAFNAAASQLKSDVSSFNARAEEYGGFTSEGEFDAQRAALINRMNALNAEVPEINAQITTFKADLTKLKALSKTAAGLVKSLNIQLEQLPQLTA